jgi:hypothetical protein
VIVMSGRGTPGFEGGLRYVEVKEETQMCDFLDEGFTTTLSEDRPGATEVQAVHGVDSLLPDVVRLFELSLLEDVLATLLGRLNLTQ